MIFQLFALNGRSQIVCFVRYQFDILNANVWITTIWNIPNISAVCIIWLSAIILCWYVIGYALLISLHFFSLKSRWFIQDLNWYQFLYRWKTVFRLQIWMIKNEKAEINIIQFTHLKQDIKCNHSYFYFLWEVINVDHRVK